MEYVVNAMESTLYPIIRKKLEDDCEGCLEGYFGQRDHACCDLDIIEKAIDRAVDTIDSLVTEVMVLDSLALEMAYKGDLFTSREVVDFLRNHSPLNIATKLDHKLKEMLLYSLYHSFNLSL